MTVLSTVLNRDPAGLKWDSDITRDFLTPGGKWFPKEKWNAANIGQFQTLAMKVIWQTVSEPVTVSDQNRK